MIADVAISVRKQNGYGVFSKYDRAHSLKNGAVPGLDLP
jgi:hypothetical protein